MPASVSVVKRGPWIGPGVVTGSYRNRLSRVHARGKARMITSILSNLFGRGVQDSSMCRWVRGAPVVGSVVHYRTDDRSTAHPPTHARILHTASKEIAQYRRNHPCFASSVYSA